MDERLQKVFRMAVGREGRVILAADEIKKAALATWMEALAEKGVARPFPGPSTVDEYLRYEAVMEQPSIRTLVDGCIDRIWLAIDGILIAAANIQKLLWGASGKRAVERSDLRTALGVAESSYFHDPVMRNHFEHFDERLEWWYTKSPNRNFVDSNIGWMIAVPDPMDYLRNYDTSTDVVSFWGDTVEIGRLVAETRPLLERVESLPT